MKENYYELKDVEHTFNCEGKEYCVVYTPVPGAGLLWIVKVEEWFRNEHDDLMLSTLADNLTYEGRVSLEMSLVTLDRVLNK